MLSLDVIAFTIFLLIVGIHVLFRKKKIKFWYGVFLEYWSGGLGWIYHVAKKYNKFLKRVGDASIVIGFVLSFVGIGFLVYSLTTLKPSLAFALPSLAGYKYPGPVISVPFWYWLIVIFVVAFPHETFHAIFSAVERVKIRKYGILYLFLLPIGAFVDPEKKQFKKLRLRGKLRVLSAGSFANILTSVLVIGLMLLTGFLIPYIMHSDGVAFESTVPNTSAYYNNLTGVIKEINGTRVTNVNDLVAALKKLQPNQTVAICTTKGKYNIKLSEENNRTIIGIRGVSNHYVFNSGREVPAYIQNLIVYWENLLVWLFLFTLGVGIANMLPAKPLDGGLVFEEILKKYLGKKRGKAISNYLTVGMWILLFLALVLPWIIRGPRLF